MSTKSSDNRLQDETENAPSRPSSEIQENMARLRELRLAKEAEAVRLRIAKAGGQAKSHKSRSRFR